MSTKAVKISAAALTLSMLGMATLPIANAAEASADIRISNYESVSATMSATGEVEGAIIVDQLTILGNGEVAVANPVAGDKVRNLSTFEELASTGGTVETTVDVNGSQELRTLSDYTGELPVSLTAKYFLDGEEIDPSELANVTGTLEVEYTVRNETGKMETISYVNAAGETVTKEVMVYTPIAGEFVTDLPSSFSNAQAKGAAVAANGRGSTTMKWSLTLLPPLSAPEVTFGYTADLVDATLPEANLTVIPVKPYENSTASSAVNSYENGAEAGSTIYAGGSAMNDGLGQLADGAGTLMAGIAQLYAGSGDLKDGLVSANDGAAQLNDGALQLEDGLATLKGAVGMLSDLDAFGMIVDGLAKIGTNNTEIGRLLGEVKVQLDAVKSELTAATEDLGGAKSAITEAFGGRAVTIDGEEIDAEALVAELIAGIDAAQAHIDTAAAAAGVASTTAAKVGKQTGSIAMQVKILTGLVDTLGGLILGDLADGVNQLADGSVQLVDGTDTLVDGAKQLLDGATQINDGLAIADSNMPTLMAGIDKLTNEGAREFMASGLDTQMEYEELVTQVAAAAARAEDGALPVGAPANAHVATAAYTFEVAGTEADGPSAFVLAGVGVGIFAAAGLGLAVTRRRG